MAFTANLDELVPYPSGWMETCEGGELQQRLALYQIFLKLYEQNRGLLDEILKLENSGSKSLATVSLPFIQGVVLGQEIYIVTNLFQGKTQALMQPQQTWLIGRDPSQVVLPIQDDRLSRCHAALKYIENEGFYLVDLGSRNGSYVNGEQVRERLLRDGDRIRLGSVTFVFFLCQTVRHLRSVSSTAALGTCKSEIKSDMMSDIASEIITDLDIEESTQARQEGINLSRENAEALDIIVAESLDETFRFMRSGLI